MKPLKREVWKSSDGKEEHHFFTEENGKEVYFFGFNPKIVDPELASAISNVLIKIAERKQ